MDAYLFPQQAPASWGRRTSGHQASSETETKHIKSHVQLKSDDYIDS